MTEWEYVADKTADMRRIFERETALYIDESDCETMIGLFSAYKAVCLVNDSMAGKVVGDHMVITVGQMLDMGIKQLILACSIHTAEEVYRRISGQCRAGGIKIYNMYGIDMETFHKKLMRKYTEYPSLDENAIKRAIDKHDIISFDIDGTLLTPIYLYSTDFYWIIDAFLKKNKIYAERFVDKIVTLRSSNYNLTVFQLIEQVLEKEEEIGKVTEAIWDKVFVEMHKAFRARKAVVEAFHYASSQNKTVCLVEDVPDYRMTKEQWGKLLEAYGLSGYDYIFSCIEFGQNKYSGLYRSVKERYGERTVLHIGDNFETDIFMPEIYGIDTFWVAHPVELFQGMDTVRAELLENRNVRRLFEKYLMNTYNDEYVISRVRERKQENHGQADYFEERKEFYKAHNEVFDFELELIEDICDAKSLEEYETLRFPVYDEPLVSIIIPVYNQFAYTYACLKSILLHSEGTSYEVIIADDCSNDCTVEIEKVASGIKVLHNEKNLKFLLNCNHAAEYARGKYILFLNNDTQVQPDWLTSLTDYMEGHSDVGMVGSRLVYPDGFLQEAGGILWKDGSAWNYGCMKNPDDAEYNYVKEVDYVSGASIMIRAFLWKEIGGFDETFAPAYYEDTDLAFEVRKHGYKVCMQPQSVVVHFEGRSNGTDVSAGLKSYQVVNQKKFYDKWKATLEKDHFENGEDVYLAKDRGQTRKQILVVDHYVPNFDKDAGGRCTYMYLKVFVKLGMKVTFIGDNFAKPEPYTSILNQLGVEVLYGNNYFLHWEEWLENNLKYFDYIYLQRPHISIKYIDIVKKFARGKIFYFAHDLGHVRLYRDYLLTGNQETLAESRACKKMELELFGKADVCHVVGSYEQKVMQEMFPEKPIRNIPLYIYEEYPQNIEKDFSKRNDIIFVGGFNHKPNVDGVLWFAKEVYPKIVEKYPDMVWHIVGSHVSEEIRALESKNIEIKGFVSDEKLEQLYRECRLAVVPLRFGAGVKGKVVEAAYYQIPMVTTSIGGEGLDDSVGAFVMEDDPDGMAERIVSLYTQYDVLRKMSDAGQEFIGKYFTLEVAENILREDMDDFHNPCGERKA